MAFLFFTYEERLLSEVTGTIVENEIFFSVPDFDIHFSEGRLLFRGAGHEDRDAEFTFTRSSSNCWSD